MRLLQFIKTFIKQQICRHIALLLNDQLYIVQWGKTLSFHPVDATHAKLIILGSGHYFETSQKLPVTNLSEGEKLLKHLHVDAPVDGQKLSLLQQYQDAIIANSVVMCESPKVSSAWFLLPIHWLLNTAKVNHYQILDRILQVSNRFGEVQSHLIQETNQPERCFSEHQTCEALLSGLTRIPLHVWRFAKQQSNKAFLSRISFMQLFVTINSVAILYLSITSLGLFAFEKWINSDITEQSRSVNVALDIRNENQTKTQQLSALNNAIASYDEYMYIWPVLSFTAQNDINVTAMTLREGKVELFGNVKIVSDFMQQLESFPQVGDAQLLSAIRENKRLQRQNYAIGWDILQSDNVPDLSRGASDAVE